MTNALRRRACDRRVTQGEDHVTVKAEADAAAAEQHWRLSANR